MSRAFIAFYMGDYDRDTHHLSTLEHGAYFLLLKHCWVHGSIPIEPKKRAIIANMTLRKWNIIAPTINVFFDSHGHNKRATREIEKAEKLSTRQAMAGYRGAQKRWKKDGHGIATANSHGHAPTDGHGIAIKKEDITTTYSSAAREEPAVENSAMEPAAPAAGSAEKKPKLAASPALLASPILRKYR